MLDILTLILGLILILVGANYLISGSEKIARRFGLSDFIIGLTIVGIGTSTPEMVVSFMSAIKGNADIAVGNVLGSNIFNTLVILGISAIIFPIKLTGNNIRKDIPFALLAAFVLLVLGYSTLLNGTDSNIISRVNGIMLLCFFGVFLAYTIYSSSDQKVDNQVENTNLKKGSLPLQILMVVGGLAGLIYGGDLFVESASSIAKRMGVSDAIVALTIMAGGTSLPELASCVVAALKKKSDLALGNVVGSNVANIFLILGGSATIQSLSMNNIGKLDLWTLFIASLLVVLTAFTFRKREIDRFEGVIFVLIYIGFIFVQISK